jgi:hypothetical protein
MRICGGIRRADQAGVAEENWMSLGGWRVRGARIVRQLFAALIA